MAGVNKVQYGNQVVIDISDSTVNAHTLLEGIKAYGANGDPVTGTLKLAYHITLTPEQYNELTVEEQDADENFFYLPETEPGGAFTQEANSPWNLTEDELIKYKYNGHEVFICANNGSLYAELSNGWNTVDTIPTDYAPAEALTFSAFFENTSTWDISPIMMRIRPNGNVDVASNGAANGNLYFTYNYLRETAQPRDTWFYTMASGLPFAVINDTSTALDKVWSAHKVNTAFAGVAQQNASLLTMINGKAAINDSSTDSDVTWSAQKINTELSDKATNDAVNAKASINDSSTANNVTWSAQKINSELSGKATTAAVNAKPSINDSSTANNVVWSASKINNALSGKISNKGISAATNVTGLSISNGYLQVSDGQGHVHSIEIDFALA